MIKLVWISFVFACLTAAVSAQVKPRPKSTPDRVPVKPVNKPSVDKGIVTGRTYTNAYFRFEVTLPDSWLIPDDDFEEDMKKQGIDLTLKAPDSLTPTGKARLNDALRRVTILLTAYRSMPGTADNAVLRISVESLADNPQIKDAVDYFDAIRATYKTLKLPADFTYSETKAEQLGAMQFGFLDASSKDGKKRMYATVRNGHAILFTLSYSNTNDLATMRRLLEGGNFALNTP